MRRVTFIPLVGPQPFHRRVHGGHCQLFFPDPAGVRLRRPRTFTYRRWHADGRFDVDFVLHDGNGPAAVWLRQARHGDNLQWRHGGPPKVSLAGPCDDAAVLIGDMTALPLISTLIENAHIGRDIRALMLLNDSHTQLPPVEPGRPVKISRYKTVSQVEAELRTMTFGQSGLLFVACEANKMRRLRRFALDDLELSGKQVITSGYWKAGLTAEEIDAAKRGPDWFADTNLSGVGHEQPRHSMA
nr:siderophore-interacting protein [Loktanella sp. SALINAS62]